jgi:hypothetical protein
VAFTGEEGVDAGGLTREFFHLVCHELLSGRYGLFVQEEEHHVLFFNAGAEAMHAEYALLGKLAGLAVFNGVLLELNLAKPVFAKMLGRRLGFGDLSAVNSQLYAGMVQLLQYPGDDAQEVFCVDFTASLSVFGIRRLWRWGCTRRS